MPSLDHAHALVIGISGYPHVRSLPRVDDAKDIATALADPDLCGYPAANVQLLEEDRATRRAILDGLADLARRAGPESTVFFYFSGHGHQIGDDAGIRRFLLPFDAVHAADEDLARTAISGAEFTEALLAIPSQRLTVILDCCHAAGIGEPRNLTAAPAIGNGLDEAYLDQLKQGKGRGRVIIAATRASDPAWVVPGSRYGTFTGHLLKGLRGDARGDGGVIRILDLYTYVQQAVAADRPDQHPVLKVELEENYPIARYRGGRFLAAAPAEKPADSFAYDVFLNYADREPDKTWVRKTLYPRLKAEGLKVCLDVVDFRIGEPLIKEMERAVEESRYTAAVLTPAYLSSSFSEFEGVIAQHLGLEESRRRFLGLLREPCRPRLGIRALYYLDMSDDTEVDMGVARLVGQLREAPGGKPAKT
jgi:hypothetical protein